MSKDILYSIGELSDVVHLPVKTLRYYDQIDLLKPAYIDPDTNYRYYSNEELFKISIIKELKLFEFSLKQIKEFLKRENLTRIKELYCDKKEEIVTQIDHLQKIKNRIENRFECFENTFESFDNKSDCENKYFIQLKRIDARPVVFYRIRSEFNLSEFSLRCIKLHNIIEDNSLYISGPFMAIFHDDYSAFNPLDADIETCGPIYNGNNLKKPFIRNLEGGLYATVVAKGEYEDSKKAHQRLKNWIKDKGYKITGPTIKIYILNSKLIMSAKHFTSELQIKVEK
jgi:DNA-binding transcriptional MerR regulator/effector-binding domain-containing protein